MDRTIVWEGDTEYGHYQVVDGLYDNRQARVLYSGDRQAAQSGVAQDDQPELLFDYNQRMFELTTSLAPKRLLLIGGGVSTLPAALLKALPDIKIDVVEIDKGLTDLAYKYFELPVDERLHFFHTDGRSFLRSSKTRYDMVLVDAFVHDHIPTELKTVQAFQAYYKHLLPQGVLAMNVISGYHGPSASIMREIYAGACQVFETIDIFLASRGYSLLLPQNFVLAAQKNTPVPLKDYVRHEAVNPPEVNPNEALSD